MDYEIRLKNLSVEDLGWWLARIESLAPYTMKHKEYEIWYGDTRFEMVFNDADEFSFKEVGKRETVQQVRK